MGRPLTPLPCPSPAGSLLLEAAEHIDCAVPEGIIERLEREAIRDVWQLDYLDSFQWEKMGVSMGLVASIRRFLDDKKANKKQTEQQRRQPEERRRASEGTPRRRLSPIRDSGRFLRASLNLPLTSSMASSSSTPPQEVSVLPVLDLCRQVSGITIPGGLDKRSSFVSQFEEADDEFNPATPSFTSKRLEVGSSPRTAASPVSVQQESVDTYFPPIMPERKESQRHLPFCCLDEEDDDDDETLSECGYNDTPLAEDGPWSSTRGSGSALDESVRSLLPPAIPNRMASCDATLATEGEDLLA